MDDDSGTLRRAIGQQIREIRISQGLTLREAAARCGLSHAMLALIEKEGQNTTIDKLERIMQGLGVSMEVVRRDDGTVGLVSRGAGESLGDRLAIGQRFLRVLPSIPSEEIDVFVHELALWEHRYGSK